MSVAARQLRNNICPHGSHRVFADANAAIGLRQLPAFMRNALLHMLCDVAEVALVRPAVVDFWQDESMLQLRLGKVLVLYSVDRGGDLHVRHVVGDASAANR